ATLAATSASISTPVPAVVFTFDAIATPFSHTRRVTAMWLSGSGWHIGISSEVRFAAIIPAIRATSSGSPLGFEGSDRSTLFFIRTNALASAARAHHNAKAFSPSKSGYRILRSPARAEINRQSFSVFLCGRLFLLTQEAERKRSVQSSTETHSPAAIRSRSGGITI